MNLFKKIKKKIFGEIVSSHVGWVEGTMCVGNLFTNFPIDGKFEIVKCVHTKTPREYWYEVRHPSVNLSFPTSSAELKAAGYGHIL